MAVFKSLQKRLDRQKILKKTAELKDRNITIISNNCAGGFIYKDLNLVFNSPTIGLFFYSPDYIKFLKELDYYLAKELSFTDKSKYKGEFAYPIGLLDEIEIHFVHYKDETHARTKWDLRKTRILKDRLFILGAEVMECTPEIIREFDELPYKNKLFFSQHAYPQFGSTVQLKEYENCEFEDYMRWRGWNMYVDLIKWFNGDANYRIKG
ncbi:MAG: DUF1919 domain-containing protein [Terracidiphilus sp.]